MALPLASEGWEPPPLPRTALGNPYVPGALRDLSVSRSSFTWGIPVPEPAASETKQPHVIYVWLDALANYMTALGYGSDDPVDIEKFKKYWPADLHLVGKEIIRFHCVYWPAFLLAAGLPLPKAVTAHGWLLFDDAKMSKSKGNIVRTETILDAFGTLCPPIPLLSSHSEAEGSASPAPPRQPNKQEQDLFATDVLRYFLLREIPFGQDGSFTFDALITRYNADLANGYGNLVSRTLSMIHRYFGGVVLASERQDNPWSYFLMMVPLVIEQFGAFELSYILTNTSNLVTMTDGSITKNAPWKLAGLEDEASRNTLRSVLYGAAEAIRIITALLYPILPYATAKVWQQLGLGDIEVAAKNGDLKNLQWGGLQPGTKLGPLSPIFPRADKGLAQIMLDMEAAKAVPAPSPLIDEKPPAAPEQHDTNDPAAGPRTTAFTEPNPGASVAGSHALTTERVETPHTEARASGPFAAAALATSTPDTPQIAIDDFVKVDLRVAKVLVAERIPKADKLLRLEVDLGYERRQILSGIAEWYTPEELIGRRIVVIANLAPRTMRGLESHGMLLAASDGDNGKPILATFSEESALGSRVR